MTLKKTIKKNNKKPVKKNSSHPRSHRAPPTGPPRKQGEPTRGAQPRFVPRRKCVSVHTLSLTLSYQLYSSMHFDPYTLP